MNVGTRSHQAAASASRDSVAGWFTERPSKWRTGNMHQGQRNKDALVQSDSIALRYVISSTLSHSPRPRRLPYGPASCVLYPLIGSRRLSLQCMLLQPSPSRTHTSQCLQTSNPLSNPINQSPISTRDQPSKQNAMYYSPFVFCLSRPSVRLFVFVRFHYLVTLVKMVTFTFFFAAAF